jgi:hypothetical protein
MLANEDSNLFSFGFGHDIDFRSARPAICSGRNSIDARNDYVFTQR